MEELDQNKLLHDALRLMAVEIQGLTDFYNPNCARATEFSTLKRIVSLGRCILQMQKMPCFSQFLAVYLDQLI